MKVGDHLRYSHQALNTFNLKTYTDKNTQIHIYMHWDKPPSSLSAERRSTVLETGNPFHNVIREVVWTIPFEYDSMQPLFKVVRILGPSSNLLQYCVCAHVQSCPTLCKPMDCGPPGTSVHGIFQARILEWVAISFSNTVQSI